MQTCASCPWPCVASGGIASWKLTSTRAHLSVRLSSAVQACSKFFNSVCTTRNSFPYPPGFRVVKQHHRITTSRGQRQVVSLCNKIKCATRFRTYDQIRIRISPSISSQDSRTREPSRGTSNLAAEVPQSKQLGPKQFRIHIGA